MEKITIGVEGMMCPMCEAHVNDAVRNRYDVKKVKSSRKKNETVIEAEDGLVDEAEIRRIITETGYTVTSFERRSK